MGMQTGLFTDADKKIDQSRKSKSSTQTPAQVPYRIPPSQDPTSIMPLPISAKGHPQRQMCQIRHFLRDDRFCCNLIDI